MHESQLKCQEIFSINFREEFSINWTDGGLYVPKTLAGE